MHNLRQSTADNPHPSLGRWTYGLLYSPYCEPGSRPSDSQLMFRGYVTIGRNHNSRRADVGSPG